MKTVTLNNCVEMPILGFGVFRIPRRQKSVKCSVFDALHVGYRLIDTASAYGAAEEAVGQAIKRSGIARDEIFVTTKLWVSNAGHEKDERRL